jgi:hypothetical protein
VDVEPSEAQLVYSFGTQMDVKLNAGFEIIRTGRGIADGMV